MGFKYDSAYLPFMFSYLRSTRYFILESVTLSNFET